MKQKFKLPNKKKLVSLGFFYKQDQDCGLGLAAHQGHEHYDMLLQASVLCTQNFNQEVRAVLKGEGEYAVFNKDLSLFQQEIKKNMEICIPWLKDPNATTEQWVKHLIGFVTGVIYLSKWGLLEQDDYNGTLYTFTSKFKN